MRALALHLFRVALIVQGALLVPSFLYAANNVESVIVQSGSCSVSPDNWYSNVQEAIDTGLECFDQSYQQNDNTALIGRFETIKENDGSPVQVSKYKQWYDRQKTNGDINTDFNAITIEKMTCVSGYIWDDSAKDCVQQSCPQGTTRNDSGICIDDGPACEQGFYPITSSSGLEPGTRCIGGCKTKVKVSFTFSDGSAVGTGENLGEECADPEPDAEQSSNPSEPAGDCDVKPSSIPGCHFCGTDLICPESFPPNGCIESTSGHLFCTEGVEDLPPAEQPQTDSDGDGQPDGDADPQAQQKSIENNYTTENTSTSTNTYNYYGDETIPPEGTSQTGDDTCGGANQPECTNDSDMPEGFNGEFPGEDPFSDVTSRDNQQDYQQISTEGQISDKFSSITGGGACTPYTTGTLDIFGESYGPLEIDLCTYADDIRTLILVLLSGFAIIGVWEKFHRVTSET